MDYEAFLRAKSECARTIGIAPGGMSDVLFAHQRRITEWALRRGRAAVFADTGLGKTLVELEWARVVAGRGRVLIVAPLAVAQQIVGEAHRFGYSAAYARNDSDRHPVVVTNYEMVGAFDPREFCGVVLDESSILKSFTGRTRTLLIEAFGRTPFRLCCTATPAPNDHTELGNHAEFLGIRSRAEMLAEFFVHDGGSTQDWRLKGHAVDPFWEWVSSWGLMVQKPSDVGGDDMMYELPPMRMHEHVIAADHAAAHADGHLFAPPARGLSEARASRRATVDERIRKAAEIAHGPGSVVVWCELNTESERLAKSIPGAIEVRGSHSPDDKTDRLHGFSSGKYRVMVTKPSIAGFGLNWQHCSTMVFVGASYSYEQTYQAIRRCWRFGQSRPVDVHIIRAETEDHVVETYRRKERDAAELARRMVGATRRSVGGDAVTVGRWVDYNANEKVRVPW